MDDDLDDISTTFVSASVEVPTQDNSQIGASLPPITLVRDKISIQRSLRLSV